MIPIKTESAWKGTSDCRNCGIRDMVLFADLNEQDFGQIHAPIDDLELQAGTTLFAEGAGASAIFTLRSGMIKLVRVTPDGRQRIVRVLRPGDVAGLEALATSRYGSEAVALSDISVCRIPAQVINALGSSSTRLHKRLMEKWQSALREADDWLADLNFGTARQRVAHFILKMRNQADAQDLKLETVSREVSALVREGVIEPLDKHGRIYRVLDLPALQAI